MSFGFSVGDFIVVCKLAQSLFKRCNNAAAELDGIRQEIRSLKCVLQELGDEILREELLFSHTTDGRPGSRTGRLNGEAGHSTADNEALADQIAKTRDKLSSLDQQLEQLSFKSAILR